MKVVCKSGIYSLHVSVFLLLPLKDLVAHKGVELFSLLFSFLDCLADLQFRKQHRFSCSVWVDDDFSKRMVVEAFLHYRPHLNDHSSVIRENSDSGGIRTHLSEFTATWTKRHRPPGHPAYVLYFRRASVYVRDLPLASKASQKFVRYCKPLSQGQPALEKKQTILFWQVSCILFRYAFTSGYWSPFVFWRFKLLITEWTLPFCFSVASSVNQTFKNENDSELVAWHELVKTVPKGRVL